MPLTRDDLKAIAEIVDERIEPIKADISNIKADIANMKTDISNIKTDISNMKHDISSIEGEMVLMNARIENIDRTLKAQVKIVNDLQQSVGFNR